MLLSRIRLVLLVALLALGAAAVPASADAPADGGGQPWAETGASPADAAPDAAPDDTSDDGAAVADDGFDPDASMPVVPWTPPETQPAPATSPPAFLPVVVGRTVPGRVARLHADGTAAIPRGAPKRVRTVIAAANQIIGKPYKWGGGHASLVDRGYDCSGAVSYALIGGRLLGGVMVSGGLARWASAGLGRWISIYANKGHVYMEIAGLRFDTSPVGDPTARSGVRWRPVIGRRGGFAARHPVGL
jgi:hypothetical protein